MEENQSNPKNRKNNASKRIGTIFLICGVVLWLLKTAYKRFLFFGNVSFEMLENSFFVSLACSIAAVLCFIISIIFFSRVPEIVEKRQAGQSFLESKKDFIVVGVVALIGWAIAAILVPVFKISLIDDLFGDIMFVGIPISGLIYIIKTGIITKIPGLIKRGGIFVHNFAVFFFGVPFIGIPLGVLAWAFFMLIYVGVCIGALLGVLYSFIFVLLLKLLTFVLCLLGVQVPGKVMKWIELVGCVIAAVMLGGMMFFVFFDALM